MVNLASSSTDAFTPSQVILGDADVVTKSVTVVSGQTLAALTVVGVITASGKYAVCNLAAENGTEVPAGILVNAVNASGGDKDGTVYLGGDFNIAALVWGASFTTAVLKNAAFLGTNIVVRTSTYSVG